MTTSEKSARHFRRKFIATTDTMPSLDGAVVNWFNEGEDDSKFRQKRWDLENGKPTLAASLYGFKRGIAVIAGKPNHGKSSLITNMMIAGLRNDPNLMIVDISLDDDHEKRMQQYIACITGLDYQLVTSKFVDAHSKKLIEDAKAELLTYIDQDRLRTYSDEEEVIDEETGETLKYSIRTFKVLFATMQEARRTHPDRKIYFFLDAWQDMKFEGGQETQTAHANEMVAQLKQLCKKTDIGIFLNCHLRKTQGSKPTIEDIKGTSDMYFAAVWAVIVWNEYRENPYKDPLMMIEGSYKYPVIAIEIKKSKVSDWDYDLYYGLKSNCNQLVPLDIEEFKNKRTLASGRKK